MRDHAIVCLSLLLLMVLVNQGLGERTKDKIYYDTKANVTRMCFRRLNATHQFGCSSSRGGNIGVLHYVKDNADIEWVTKTGPNPPYIVLLGPLMFTPGNVMLFKSSGRVNGLLVPFNATFHQEDFSPDRRCPNEQFELYRGDEEFSSCRKNVWNPEGNGLIFEDLPFPIISMQNEQDVDFFIHECFEKYNKPTGNVTRDYPLCGAEVMSYMNAIKDSPTCLRKGQTRNLSPEQFCDPLSNSNVFSFIHHPPLQSEPDLANKSVIVASARLDVAGLFDQLYPGTEATVVGFVSLLAAAEALGKVRDSFDVTRHRPILFSFFQGEAFDYSGSNRMLYDMEQGNFPYEPSNDDKKKNDEADTDKPRAIYPHHIGHFLELSQVALPENNVMWLHSDPRSRRNEDINETAVELEEMMSDYGKDLDLDLRPTDSDLPLLPASLQTFLRYANFTGLVLADHHQHYRNRFYSGRYDLPSTVNHNVSNLENMTVAELEVASSQLSTHLTNIATVTARTLYSLSTGVKSDNITANHTLVSQLLFCFFYSAQCELFNFTSKPEDKLSSAPYNYYVGVHGINPVSYYVERLLSYFLGTNVRDKYSTEEECKEAKSSAYQYIWMRGPVNTSDPTHARIGICVESSADVSSGVSPAFDVDGYDFSSRKYPAWTESIWPSNSPRVRVFLMPDRSYEIGCLCGGLALFVVSMVVVYVCQKRRALLFDQPHSLLSTSDPDTVNT